MGFNLLEATLLGRTRKTADAGTNYSDYSIKSGVAQFPDMTAEDERYLCELVREALKIISGKPAITHTLAAESQMVYAGFSQLQAAFPDITRVFDHLSIENDYDSTAVRPVYEALLNCAGHGQPVDGTKKPQEQVSVSIYLSNLKIEPSKLSFLPSRTEVLGSLEYKIAIFENEVSEAGRPEREDVHNGTGISDMRRYADMTLIFRYTNGKERNITVLGYLF